MIVMLDEWEVRSYTIILSLQFMTINTKFTQVFLMLNFGGYEKPSL